MKILIYGINYSPELTGIGKYTGEMALWLQRNGHEVRVVTAPPYYPAWRVGESHRNRYSREEVPGSPRVFRCPLYVPERPTGIKRVAHLASFMASSLPVMLGQIWWQPEVVLTIEPTFFCAPVALLVARAAGAASWLHVQDFEVDAAFDLGLLRPGGVVHRVALGLEEFFMRLFDRVSSISQKMVERLMQKGVPKTSRVLFPNWVDVDAIEARSCGLPDNRFRRELKLGSKTVLLYSGNMGAKQGLEVLGPLARSFAGDGRVHFVFCGDGAFRPQLQEEVQGLSNVTMLPLQPQERLNELLNAAEIHLLPQRSGAADLVMPSKLTGMLASGRPVLATADAGTQVALVVEGEDSSIARGLVVPAEDEVALRKAVETLVESPAMRARLGSAARAYAVRHLGCEQVLQRFEYELRRACGAG